MSSPDSKYNLRTMQASDSASISRLVTEFDGDLTTNFLVDAYTAITCGTDNETIGVVVECADYDGLVGMGTVRFSEIQFNEGILPLAFLDGLKVHKDYRGQGLGYKIARWRIDQARENYGEPCVIATGMLLENNASRGVAKKWCREFLEPGCLSLIIPVRNKPPKSLAGISVGELEPHQFDEFAAKQNRYFQDYNFYSQSDLTSMARTCNVSANGKKPYRFFAALDAQGNLLAGAQTWARGMIKSDIINNPPMPLRVMNTFAHLLPSDFTIHEILVKGLWYEQNRIDVARYLWEMVRWYGRDQGNTVVIVLDPRDPIQNVVSLKPWNQPRPKITIAIHGPDAINRQKFLFGMGRV